MNFYLPEAGMYLYDHENTTVSAIYVIRKISLFLLACFSQRLNLFVLPLLIPPHIQMSEDILILIPVKEMEQVSIIHCN